MVFLSCQANVRTVHQLLPSTSFPIHYSTVSLTFGAIQGEVVTVPQESDQLLYLCLCNRQVKNIRWVWTCLTYLSLARFQASTIVQTRSLQVRVAMHHILVAVYRRCETAYQGPCYNPSTASPLGPVDRVFQNIVQHLLTQCATTQNSEELTYLSLTQEGGLLSWLQVSWNRGRNICIPIHFILMTCKHHQ